MADKIQNQLESAFHDLISEVDFGSYDPVLRQWREGSEGVDYPAVIVQSGPLSQGAGIGRTWENVISLLSLTYAPDDQDQEALNSIHDQVLRRVLTVTKDQVQAKVSGFTVHGVFLEDTSATAEDNEQRQAVDIRIYIEADLSNVSTTTTTT